MPLPNLSPPSADTPLNLAPGDMVKAGWEFIKPHIVVLDVSLLAMIVASVLLSQVPLIGHVLSWLASTFFSPGIIFYLWRAKLKESPTAGDLLVPLQDKAGGILLTSLATSLAVGLGLVLLILPGIYVAICLCLAVPLVTLTTLSVGDSLSLSWKIVHKHFVDFFVLALVVVALNIGGALLLGVGLFVTLPLSCGIFMAVLEQLLTQSSRG